MEHPYGLVIIPPNYLNKLRKGIKRIYLETDTKFSGVH
jgi:hypothetical protein